MSLVERAALRLRARTPEGEPTPQSTPAGQKAPDRDPPVRIAGIAERIPAVPPRAAAGDARAAMRPRSKPTVAFDQDALTRAGIVGSSAMRSRVTEELRIIKRQLLSPALSEGRDGEARADVIMVTSALPAEGKTFTALNLALSIAHEEDHHVLLVDADGARQGLRRFLVAGDLPGLLDLAADPTVDVADVILGTEIPRLSVVLAGTHREHGAELLASQRMRSLIGEMAARYDDRVIVLDAPPCLVSSDPAALAAIVGQVVLVIEADRTQRGEVEGSLELLRACPRISLILNKRKAVTSDSFGSYPYNYQPIGATGQARGKNVY